MAVDLVWKEYNAFKEHWTLIKEQLKGHQGLIPEPTNIFRAFHLPEKDVRVVFVGLSPYPDGKTASGLAFATSTSFNTIEEYPASLKVLAKALAKHYNKDVKAIENYFDSTLLMWEAQGVLLLNMALTCTKSNPNIHIEFWKPFTKSLIKELSFRKEKLIFYLLGKEAQSLQYEIDTLKHIVITDSHPAFYARQEKEMPNNFTAISKLYKDYFKTNIDWILPF